MNSYTVRVLLWGVILILLSGNVFAEERWVYRYDGPGSEGDYGRAITMALDGNLYAAGESWASGTSRDFTVVSLTEAGVERWVYRYDGPGNASDESNSITTGSDGSVYAAGWSQGSGTAEDIVVVSLTESGVERWVYRYNGTADSMDAAGSVVMGSDGNLYAAGVSCGLGTSLDFAVVSLDTSGGERWVYRYDGPGNSWDLAYSLVMGTDGNLYAAGYSIGSGTSLDFTVVSLDTSGGERWVYRYDGPASQSDIAVAIAAGEDGYLYAVGESGGSGTSSDFTVVSLDTSGGERWVYRYDGPGSLDDRAKAITVGSDSCVYAAGFSQGSGTGDDFTVVSLNASGGERWIYSYNGSAGGADGAVSIVMGSDGNLHGAGWSYETGSSFDFTVISLTASGAERWVYRYNGPSDTTDYASCIAAGWDGNLYVVGYGLEAWTSNDFIVVSLDTSVGVEEKLSRLSLGDSSLLQNSPNPFHNSTVILYSLAAATEVTLEIHDITGRLVETLVNETQEPGIHQVNWDRRDNPSGVYFYSLKACPERSRRAGEFVETKKMVLID